MKLRTALYDGHTEIVTQADLEAASTFVGATVGGAAGDLLVSDGAGNADAFTAGAGEVVFVDGSGHAATSANLKWDGTELIMPELWTDIIVSKAGAQINIQSDIAAQSELILFADGSSTLTNFAVTPNVSSFGIDADGSVHIKELVGSALPGGASWNADGSGEVVFGSGVTISADDAGIFSVVGPLGSITVDAAGLISFANDTGGWKISASTAALLNTGGQFDIGATAGFEIGNIFCTSISAANGFSGTVTTASLVGKTITIAKGIITGFA